jgi:branched-subunit amino acid transport protein
MIWAVIILSGLLTFAARFIMLSPLAPKSIPDAAARVLRFVPVAVLSAIITPSVFLSGGAAVPLWDAQVIAAAVAAAVALISRSVLITLIAGMATLWSVGYFLG